MTETPPSTPKLTAHSPAMASGATTSGGAAPDGADPSMEDILASIRRILSDDDKPPVDEAPPEEDVLILDSSMMVSSGAEQVPEVEPSAVAQSGRQEMEVATPPDPVAPPDPTPDLVAPEPAAAAASSVGNLVRALTAGRATQVYSGGPTLEDIVRAELRPLLKEWLDSNLPSVVERLVRAEIERVVGRAVP